MSYYKTIDGVKYEKSLLENADEFIKNQADGKITEAELQQLTSSVCDGGRITDTERLTLAYIVENYPLTSAAQHWFEERCPVITDEGRFRSKAYQILRKLGVGYMELRVDPRVVEDMNCFLPSKINFFDALKEAIRILLSDRKRDAPWYEVENLVDLFLGISQDDLKDAGKWPDIVTGLLKERMNCGYLQLLPVWEDLSEEERGELQIPDIDVSSRDSWVFYLGIRTDDHQFFAIVDRQGVKPPYTYGYN